MTTDTYSAETYAYKRQKAADDAVVALSEAVNGSTGPSEVGAAVANEHPTLAGQIAKGVAYGIMRRATRNPDWKAFDGYGDERVCDLPRRTLTFSSGEPFTLPVHVMHDGRIDCETVVGAELMARQSFI